MSADELSAAAADGAVCCSNLYLACPQDIVGPVLSGHQATDTWQGKVACVLSGRCVNTPAHSADCPRTGWPESPRIVMKTRVDEHQTALITSGCVPFDSPTMHEGGR